MNDYVKQLEEANHTLQQRVEELQVSNENLKRELSKYGVRFKSYGMREWHVYIGYAFIGVVKFEHDNYYTVKLQKADGWTTTKDYSSMDECHKFIIKHITEKPEGNGWKLTI